MTLVCTWHNTFELEHTLCVLSVTTYLTGKTGLPGEQAINAKQGTQVTLE